VDGRQVTGQFATGIDIVHLALQQHSLLGQKTQALGRVPGLLVVLAKLFIKYIIQIDFLWN